MVGSGCEYCELPFMDFDSSSSASEDGPKDGPYATITGSRLADTTFGASSSSLVRLVAAPCHSRSRRWQGLSRGGNAAMSGVCSVHAASTAGPIGKALPLPRLILVSIRRKRPETFVSHQREVIRVQPAIRHSLLRLALLLCNARGCRPAAFMLRNTGCDLFGRIKSHVRA